MHTIVVGIKGDGFLALEEFVVVFCNSVGSTEVVGCFC